MSDFRHIPGNLKQQNKPHKTKFASKGELKTSLKGRVESSSRTNFKKTIALTKDERKLRQKQLQNNKRKLILEEKRLGHKDHPPKVVVSFKMLNFRE